MQKILINTDGIRTSVFVDGLCLENLTSASFEHNAAGRAELVLTLVPTHLTISGNARVLTVEEAFEDE